MEATRIVLLISFFIHHIGAVDPPVVTLESQWNKIFRTESITLTCNVETTGPSDQIYYWYKNNEQQHWYEPMMRITGAEMDDAGSYQCRYGDLAMSDPVQLDVSNDWLILQANSVYEGDTLTLRCHGWDSLFGRKAKFYKDGKALSSRGFVFFKTNIGTEMSGKYRCERNRLSKNIAETYVTVYVLFSEPNLKLMEPLVMEGDEMTLKCDTSLAPPRRNTKLEFAFFRDGWRVQDYSVSDTYRVRPAQVKDSGKYTCQAKTLSNTVRKESEALSIQIQGLFSEPTLILNQSHVTEADDMTLKCGTTLARSKMSTGLKFAFYKDGRTMQEFGGSDTYRVESVQMENSGNYACQVKNANGAVKKRSKNVFIQIKAAFGQIEFRLSANEVVVGDDVVLSCESTITSLPIHYAFYQNGTILSNLTVNQKGAAVKRVRVDSPAMAGSYYCTCDNGNAKQRQISNMFTLLVIDPVSGINISLDKAGESFVLGTSLTFGCSVENGTSPSFFWIHNGKLVDEESELFRLRDHGKVLHIISFRYYHAGAYQCYVRNTGANRTFSLVSDIRNINILERSSLGEESLTEDDDLNEAEMSILWTLLVVLVLLAALSGVLVVYRYKVCFIVPWFQQKTKAGDTFARVRPRVGPPETHIYSIKPESTTNGQEDYSNVPNMAHCATDDVCYSQIQINQLRGFTDNIRGQGELSVTYSAVNCSETKMDRTQMEDGTELYENFQSRES